MSAPHVDTPPRDEILAALVGIAAWLVALVVLAVFFRHDLQRHHATWWLWSCGFGLLLGLYGLRFALRRRGRGSLSDGSVDGGSVGSG